MLLLVHALYLYCVYSSVSFSFNLLVVVVGFVDTMVEVNETDGQVTLNVSISSPRPNPYFGFGIMFSLNVASMEGSAGRNNNS